MIWCTVLSDTDLTPSELATQLLNEGDTDKRHAVYRRHEVGIEVVQALKDEVDRFKDADSARALLAGERAFEAGEFVKDEGARPLGQWALALGLTVQGRFVEALPHFEAARSEYRRVGQPENAARAATRQVQALAMTGDFEGALILAQESRDAFVEVGLVREAAQSNNNIGTIFIRLGRIDEARDALEEALTGFEKTDDRLEVAKVHLNLGDALQNQDRFREAQIHLEAARKIFEELELTQSVANTMVVLALLHRKEGQFHKALRFLSRARLLYTQLGSSSDAAVAQLEEARIHLDLNLLGEAERFARELVAFFGERDMQLERVEALAVLGTARARGDDKGEALATLEEARAGWSKMGNAAQAALADLSIATLLLEVGQEEEAPTHLQRALERAQLALLTLSEEGVRSGQALALLTLAEGFLLKGELAAVETHLKEAQTLVELLGIPNLIIRMEQLQGQLALREGRLERAESHFRAAIDSLEDVRASLPVDEFKAAYIGDKETVYGDLVGLLLEEVRVREAFEYAERARSRALLEGLARGGETYSVADPEVARLNSRLAGARAELQRHFLAAESEGKESARWDEVEKGEAQVMHLVRELERLPEAAALEHVRVPSLEEVMGALNKGTLLLEFFARGDTLSAFVVTREGIRAEVEGLLSRRCGANSSA